MRADPQISAPDVPAFQELGDDTLDGRDRNRHRHAARQRGGVDAEHATRRVNEGTTGKAIVDRQVQPQQRVDLGPLPRTPRTIRAAHHAPACSQPRPWAAERDHQFADFGGRITSETRDRQALAGELQDREVGARVAPGETRRGGRAIGEGQRDILVAVDRVIRRHDHPRLPMHAARWNAPPGVYRDDRSAGRLYGIGELGRKGLQHSAHRYLRHRRASAPAHVDWSMGRGQGERHRPNRRP